MSKRKAYILGLILPAIILPSCDRSSCSPTGESSDTRQAIVVSIPRIEGLNTKGTDELDENTITNFGISAIKDYKDGTSENEWYLQEQAVVKSSSGTWAITPTAYWPLSGDLSFFFHAPSNVSYPAIQFVETNTGMPKVLFAPDTANITGQIDFCLSRPLMNYTYGDTAIRAHLVHTLSQILFYANYTGKLAPGSFVIIDEIKVCNVIGLDAVTYQRDEPYYEWDNSGTYSMLADYTLERKKQHLINDSIRKVGTAISEGKGYVKIYDTGGRLYLIPQTPGAQSKLEVVYGIYSGSYRNPTMLSQFMTVVQLPQDKPWPAGKTVNYLMTIDVGVSSRLQLTTSITEWASSGNSHNSGTPYEFD